MMALGKRRGGSVKLRSKRNGDRRAEELITCFERSLIRRKRIVIANREDLSVFEDSVIRTLTKKRCGGGERMVVQESGVRSRFEALPREILIKILCGVDHNDLKHLLLVSKAVNEATVAVKQDYFSFKTPTKIPAFRTEIDHVEDMIDSREILEPPNAPKEPCRFQSRLTREKLASISIALFTEPDEKKASRKEE